MSVEYYPLDFDSLNKGDVISTEHLEAITGRKKDTPEYALALLALRERIVRELDQRGRYVTVSCIHGTLKILTDEEAAEYNPLSFRHGLRKMGRAHRRLLNVDPTEFDDAKRAKLEQNIIVEGKMLAAARSARRLALKGHRRSTPGLPSPASES